MSDLHRARGSSWLRWGLVAIAILSGVLLFLLFSRGAAPLVDLTGSGRP